MSQFRKINGYLRIKRHSRSLYASCQRPRKVVRGLTKGVIMHVLIRTPPMRIAFTIGFLEEIQKPRNERQHLKWVIEKEIMKIDRFQNH